MSICVCSKTKVVVLCNRSILFLIIKMKNIYWQIEQINNYFGLPENSHWKKNSKPPCIIKVTFVKSLVCVIENRVVC